MDSLPNLSLIKLPPYSPGTFDPIEQVWNWLDRMCWLIAASRIATTSADACIIGLEALLYCRCGAGDATLQSRLDIQLT